MMLEFDDEINEENLVNGLVIGGTYVTENGQYCELVKSFSPTDNIICYMYNQVYYDEDYGNSSDVGYSEQIYYHGTLKAEDKFEIKTHRELSNLTTEIQRLKEKRLRLSIKAIRFLIILYFSAFSNKSRYSWFALLIDA